MVLADIGARITAALKKVMDSTVVDQEVIDELLKEICNALVSADVNMKLVFELRSNLKKTLQLEEMSAGLNRRNAIRQAVFGELCKLLDPGKEPFKPVKGKPNIVIFVGLQGNGKTTTIGKYAHHYKRKGFKPALICADTFRAGAYDQLLQNATSAKVSFYGSRTERDPVKIATDGVARLKADPEGFDLIIVDTSGRHKQESALFTEMEQIVEAIKPDQIVFVMDGSIGQAAFDQADAFRKAVSVGAVIVTKLDGHAKGGGALSAVAATQSPIIFLGTGERLENLEPFEPEPFVSKLLGWGDWKGVVDIISNAVNKEDGKMEELGRHLQEGKFSLRDMYSQFETMLNMGPLNQLMEKLPGMGQLMAGKSGDEGTKKIKSYLVIMDSMTDEELDDPKLFQGSQSRLERIARGSGRPLREVSDLLAQHKLFQGLVGSPGMQALAGGKAKGKGIPKNLQQMAKNPQQMASMLPPELLKQMGGAGNLNQLMKQVGNMGGLGGLGNLASMFGGGPKQ